MQVCRPQVVLSWQLPFSKSHHYIISGSTRDSEQIVTHNSPVAHIKGDTAKVLAKGAVSLAIAARPNKASGETGLSAVAVTTYTCKQKADIQITDVCSQAAIAAMDAFVAASVADTIALQQAPTQLPHHTTRLLIGIITGNPQKPGELQWSSQYTMNSVGKPHTVVS